jgi:hypothetical protein
MPKMLKIEVSRGSIFFISRRCSALIYPEIQGGQISWIRG